jgi:hypothetical protein
MWEVVAPDRNRGFNAPDYFREGDFRTTAGQTYAQEQLNRQDGLALPR